MGGPIDLVTIAIIVSAGLVTLGLTAWMLNRAWGNFPSRIAPSAPEIQTTPASTDREDEVPDTQLPAGASHDQLVAITHPSVYRAVLKSLEKPGSPYAAYFLRDGEHVYLVLSRIADPAQRETARRVIEGLNQDQPGGVELREMVRLLDQLERR